MTQIVSTLAALLASLFSVLFPITSPATNVAAVQHTNESQITLGAVPSTCYGVAQSITYGGSKTLPANTYTDDGLGNYFIASIATSTVALTNVSASQISTYTSQGYTYIPQTKTDVVFCADGQWYPITSKQASDYRLKNLTPVLSATSTPMTIQ